MRTVITGAAGFIGARLVKALNEQGVSEILAVDNLENAAKVSNLAGLEIEDYMDKREFLARLSAGHFDGTIETLLHQGACSDTMHPDGRYVMENNYQYSKALFEWAQEEEVPMIYASSAAVYGAARAFAEERENERPLNVYGYSKFLFDQHARRALESRTAQVVGLRYFNVYGPGEAHKGRMASVAWHAWRQFRAEGKVKLFVGSHGYADGEQQRDFIHVDDVVRVNLYFLEHRDLSGIFNCGTGRAQSFNALAAAVINTVRGTSRTSAELAREGLIEYIPFPPQLAERYQAYTEADLERLRDAGYAGRFMPVEEGVAAYVRALEQA